ncbi:MAG: hypothetical protein DCC71_11150 [Proteobacteria bacterium]|nr:MAG: hypothetical protein DCC71_11150 [Pseudomonadota bacterium]
MPCALAAAAAVLLAGTSAAQPRFAAARIDAESFAVFSPGGADAIGGVGDWGLTNGVLCAVVADPAHESNLATAGGGLVDLGHCGRGDDQLVLLQPLANLDRRGAVPVSSVEASATEQGARITTRGSVAGCEVETVYSLDARDATRLLLRTRVSRRGAGERVFAIGDVAIHAQHAVRPFGVDSRARTPADGFVHPPLDLASPISIARATRPADTRILVGAGGITPGIAYALHALGAQRSRDGGEPTPLPVVSLSAKSFSGLAAFAAPFWLGGDRLGALQMLQTLTMDVGVGETLVFEREVRVAPRADAASLTDGLFRDARRVRGRVSDPSARIAVRSDDGAVATDVAPAPDGSFALALPAGSYRAQILGGAGGETEHRFAVGASDVELGALAAPPFATVELPRGAAMRLVFLGLDGTPDPRFGDERPDARFGDDRSPPSTRTRDVSLAGIEADPRSVRVAPGRYRVIAGRGPEFGVTETELAVRGGETARLAIEAPARALDTPGWIAADLHVHAAPSEDSALPLATRVASFVAEGGEVLVATDHDHVTDYAPVIRELGLAAQLASVVGQEATSAVSTPAAPYTFGHVNVFPLAHQPTAHRRGALPNEGRRLRDLIDQVRALGGERLVQLNHARSGGDSQGFFDHLSVGHAFDPGVPLSLPPNAVLIARDPESGTRDVDFDAMEIWNGHRMSRYQMLRDDWFALLRQGEVRTATANSDSHLLAEVAATPRNLVRVAGDAPERFDERALVAAIRAGRVIGTNGPIVDARVGDAALGDTHRGAEATIRVEVRAAPWVPVARVRAFVNGVLAHEAEASHGATVSFPHRFERDAFVTIEVEGAAEPGSAWAARLPGFAPFAFTNPVFVDADADGLWTPPDPVAATP